MNKELDYIEIKKGNLMFEKATNTNEEVVKKVKKDLNTVKRIEKKLQNYDSLERFTKLVMKNKVDIWYLNNVDESLEYNTMVNDLYKGKRGTLTDDEFDFIKEMIKKYDTKTTN